MDKEISVMMMKDGSTVSVYVNDDGDLVISQKKGFFNGPKIVVDKRAIPRFLSEAERLSGCNG